MPYDSYLDFVEDLRMSCKQAVVNTWYPDLDGITAVARDEGVKLHLPDGRTDFLTRADLNDGVVKWAERARGGGDHVLVELAVKITDNRWQEIETPPWRAMSSIYSFVLAGRY